MTQTMTNDIFDRAPGHRFDPATLAASAERHHLYLRVRDHIRAGWRDLPDDLTPRNLSELAVMARARGDKKIGSLLRCAHHLATHAGVSA